MEETDYIFTDKSDGFLMFVFGHGGIKLHRARYKSESIDRFLLICPWPDAKRHRVGEVDTNDPEIGKTTDQMLQKGIKLYFDNLEGLDALLEELNLIRKGLLNNKQGEVMEKYIPTEEEKLEHQRAMISKGLAD